MIPSNIFGIFALQDLVLDYYNDYIYAGATPIFLDPSQKLDDFVEVYTMWDSKNRFQNKKQQKPLKYKL